MPSAQSRDGQSGLILSPVFRPLSASPSLGFQGRAEEQALAKGGKIHAAPGGTLRKQARRRHPRQGIDLRQEYLAVWRDAHLETSGSAAPETAIGLEPERVDARILQCP